MAQVVALRAVPSQRLAVQLAGQNCTLAVYQKSTGLYMDVDVSGSPIIDGVVCQDRNRIIRDAYLGFIGDFEFVDTQGTHDPDYTGLGARWQLVYLEVGDTG